MTAPIRSAPRLVNRLTGQIITLDEVAEKIIQLADWLENSNEELTNSIEVAAHLEAQYKDVYDDAILASELSSADRREAEARRACRLYRTSLGESLAKAKIDTEARIRVMRDTQHNVRAVISAWQSAAKAVTTAQDAWQSSGAA